MPRLSVITVNHASSDVLRACLGSLRDVDLPGGMELLVCDNGPADPGLDDALASGPGATLLREPALRRFGAANNAAARRARGRYLLFLNPDTEVPAGAIEGLVHSLDVRPRAGAVGPRLVDGHGRVEISAAPGPGLLAEAWVRSLQRVPGLWAATQAARGAHRVDWATAAALLVRAVAFRAVGGFDEGYPMYFEDADLCLRLRRAGLEIWHDPAVTILHHRGGAGGGRVARPSGPPTFAERSYLVGQLRYYRRGRGIVERAVLRRYLTLKFRHRPEMLAILRSADGGAA